MATWKKVIVSGSSAALSALTLDTALPVASGGTGAATHTDGGVLLGSGTGAITALGQATNGQLVVGSTGADPVLATLTGGANITVTNTAGAISIAATGLGSGTVQSVAATGTENGITLTSDGDSVNPTITLGGALANVANSQLSNSSVTVGTTAIALGASSTVLAGLTDVKATSFTGSFNGDGSGLTGVTGIGTTTNSLTDGNGIADFTFNGSAATSVAVEVDGITLAVGTGGVKVANSGIGAIQISSGAIGSGLSGGGGTDISVNIDNSSLAKPGGVLEVAANGIVNQMLAGGIDNTKLQNDSITVGATSIQLGNQATTIAGLTSITSTAGVFTNISNTGAVADTSLTGSFNGIFTGDGSALTGIATTLSTAGGTGTGTIALSSQTLTLEPGTGVTTTATGQKITIAANVATVSAVGVASFAAADFDVSAGAVTLNQDITVDQDLTVARDVQIGRNAVVSGNLTVAGTASFQNTQNLDVADRFIRMASGSTAAGDGGIIVQQTGPLDGEAFAYDAAVARWSMTGSFDPSTEAYTPEAFMAAVVEGGAGADTPAAVVAKYAKKGNLFVGANQDIYIYS